LLAKRLGLERAPARASISHAANIASGAAEIVMLTRAAVTLPVSADVAFA